MQNSVRKNRDVQLYHKQREYDVRGCHMCPDYWLEDVICPDYWPVTVINAYLR